jgi:hypothetical protein
MVETLWGHLKEESITALNREKAGEDRIALPKE